MKFLKINKSKIGCDSQFSLASRQAAPNPWNYRFSSKKPNVVN